MIYGKGDYRTGLTIAEQAYRFAGQKLGPEHPSTLSSVNNLAGLYQAQGRYGDAEPLYQQALAAREKVLGPEHPHTLVTQLNYTVTLVNLKQPKRALQLLECMEPRLLELAALQLRHTRQEAVRRLFLKQSNVQDVVLTLALSNPESDYLDFAAKVMLRCDLVDDPGEFLITPEHHVLFLKVRGEVDIVEDGHAAVAGDVVAAPAAGELTAADRPMGNIDDVLDRSPHHALGAGVGAAARGHHARQGFLVGDDALVGFLGFTWERWHLAGC